MRPTASSEAATAIVPPRSLSNSRERQEQGSPIATAAQYAIIQRPAKHELQYLSVALPHAPAVNCPHQRKRSTSPNRRRPIQRSGSVCTSVPACRSTASLRSSNRRVLSVLPVPSDAPRFPGRFGPAEPRLLHEGGLSPEARVKSGSGAAASTAQPRNNEIQN